MPFFFDQKKIIIILFSVCIIFILANVIVEKFYSSSPSIPSEISAEEINKAFNSALKNCGVENAWVLPAKKTKKDPVSLFASYNITLPADLPAALIIKELTNLFPDTNSIKMVVKEEKIAGKTVVNISSGEKLKIAAAFNYNKEIKRKAGSLAFLIESFEDMDKEEDSVLINSPESFGVIVIPSKPARDFVRRISEGNKEYVILLDDDIDELIYKLNPSYTEPRLKSSIRSILGDFSRAVFVMVDDNSSLYSSSAFRVIKAELEKRKVKLFKKSSFKAYSGDEIEQNLRSYLKGLGDGEAGTIIISAEDYLTIDNVRIDFRKIGYKFVNPSTVL